jgi:uncharacterized protein DUF2017
VSGTFARARGGRVKVRLGEPDRAVIAGLLEAVSDMLDPEQTDAVAEGRDADAGPSADAQDPDGAAEGPDAVAEGPDAVGGGPPAIAEPAAPDEAALLAQLESDLAVSPPADPAVARLLPDASREDPALAQSFRRLTEHELREHKRTALELAASALRRPGSVVLDDSEAQALLKGLTDVRLVLAERLGIQTDEDAEFLHAAIAAGAGDGDEAWSQAAGLYDVVTFLQEDLVHTLTP